MRLESIFVAALACMLPFSALGCADDNGNDEPAKGGASSGGSSGSNTSGSSATGGSSTGGSNSSGGSGQTGGSGGSGGELCEDRTGGALIDFAIVNDTLRVWIEDEAFIEEAERLLEAHEMRIPVFNELLDGTDCDEQWTWHPDPSDVEFADVTIELCDGVPSYIEENKQDWLNSVGSYCPWSAEVRAVTRR